MSVTPNMNITLPTPEVTTGPEWANQLVDAFDNVDAHDHTAGKGIKVPTAGLNINADLEFNNNNAIELRSTRYTNHGAVLSTTLDKNCVYFVDGDLFINNNAGTSVQLTSGNSINLSSVGTIGGDYGQPGITASATYSNSTKTFNWTQAPAQAAKMALGDLIVYETVASAIPITIKSSSGVTIGYDYWLPQSGPSGNQLWRQNSTSSGADFVTIQGTANQLTITHGASTITASLPSTLIAPGTLDTVGNFSVATNKMTVNASSGNTAIAGTLAAAGSLAIATNKFTANASTGNVLIAGDLAVNGGDITSTSTTVKLFDSVATNISIGSSISTINLGAGIADGGTTFIRTFQTTIFGRLSVGNNKFDVESATGNTVIAGTLNVGGLITGSISGNAGTASAWQNSRSLTLTGDVTGTVSGIDGSGNISISTTIGPNSVALGADTTGDYVASVAVTGVGLTASLPAEAANVLITSNATSANTASTIVARDASGNFSAGTITAAMFSGGLVAGSGTLSGGGSATIALPSTATNWIVMATYSDSASTTTAIRVDSRSGVNVTIRGAATLGFEYIAMKI